LARKTIFNIREKIRKILDWLVVGSRIQDKLHQRVCSDKPQSFEYIIFPEIATLIVIKNN
jgi:hypothetical protein